MRITCKYRHAVTSGICLLATVLLCFTNISLAAGPVDAASLPGGATVTDSDGGSGEQWGRPGGRTFEYGDFVLANFNSLEWHPISAGMAFDGEITGATLEEMTGPALIAPDTLQWTGETTISNVITAVVETVYTRFTIVSDTNFSVLAPHSVDVLATGDFAVNVLFEASLSPSGPFEPALDFFDNFPTPIAHDGFAITSFNDGFYFEELVGMSIEEHDSNMQGRFDGVDGAIDYLTIEAVNRLIDIAARVVANNQELLWVRGDLQQALDNLQQLLNTGGGDWITQEDLNFLRDILSDEHNGIRERLGDMESLILCMWIGDALFPVCPPEAPPGLPNLFALTAQVLANREVDIMAVKSPPASGKSAQVFMVLSKVNGVPVNAVITSVNAVTESLKDGINVVSPAFTAVPATTGLQSLSVDLPGNLSSTSTVVITVEYVEGDITLKGATMVSDW